MMKQSVHRKSNPEWRYLPETKTQRDRIVADGGTVVDLVYMDSMLRGLSLLGLSSSCKFLGDANMAVKKDGSGAVSVLYDISGNNFDKIQATGSKQPIHTADVQNGKWGVVFDGGDRLSYAGSPIGTGNIPLSIIAVLKTPASLATSPVFADMGTAANNQLFRFPILSTGEMYFANYNNDRSTAAGVITTNTNYILTMIHPAGALSESNPTFFKNGASQASTQGAGTGTPNIVAGTCNLGINSAEGAGWAAPIYTEMLFNVEISAAQRQAIEGVLNGHYAIY